MIPEAKSHHTNGGNVASVAEHYISKGFAVTPAHGKEAHLSDWQNRKISVEEIPKFFPPGVNIGLVCGELSGWLTDIDFDTEESVTAGHYLLPETRKSGRENSPYSHRWYICEGIESQDFLNLENRKVVEIRSTGRMTLAHPSKHPEDGDTYIWHDGDTEITKIDKKSSYTKSNS